MTRFAAPISESIWDMKYRFKDALGKPIDETVEDTWQRIANDLARPEAEETAVSVAKQSMKVPGPSKRFARWADEFYHALEDFKYVPAGRIVAGAGTERAVTLFNCYVMGTIPDSMDGIFSMLKEAALTMQQGGGIGYDFSPIRPKSSLVKKLGADASGPLSFMDCWDAMCRTVMSAGSRRGAMMATMRCDHPDIRDFITAKQDASRLRMFNLSVLVTDDFMKAVREDATWFLEHDEPPKVSPFEGEEEPRKNGTTGKYIHEITKARELWDLIMRSTYDAAEPGVIFIDRINRENNLRYIEHISSTNPCGEQPLPPYGACLLGSINLARLVQNRFEKDAFIDGDELDKLVATAVRMMDNVIEVSNFPLPQQAEEAKAKRRIGLGVTGLADALAMMCLRYGSPEAAARTRKIMQRIDHAAYRASVELAREKGAFPLFDADEYLAAGTHANSLPLGIQDDIREHGIRNALLTSIAPTGTISLYAGNVSSGIEPIFAYSYTRKVLQPDGSKTEERVEDYAVAAYREFWEGNGWDGHPPAEFDPETDLPDYFVTAQTLTPEDHLVMQAAAQEHVDSSISKTINCPEDISFEDFVAVYERAYDLGCKGCTTYRPNEITGSVLSVDEKPKEEAPRDATRHQLTVLDQSGETVLMGYATEIRIDRMDYEVENMDINHEPVFDYTITAEVFENIGITAEMETGPGRNYDREQIAAMPGVLTEEQARRQAKAAAAMTAPYGLDRLPERPDELEGSTYKIKVGDQKAVYLTINDTVESDGTVRPFEIFLRSSDPQHDEWMVALARMISAIMRRPHDASFIGPELMRVTSAVSGGFQKGQGYQPSLVAAIGRKIKEHVERCSFMVASDMKWPVSPEFARQANGPNDLLKKAMTGTPNWNTPKGYNWTMAEAVAQTANSDLGGDHLPEFATNRPCPECSSYNTKTESGCLTCLDCGHSKCG